MDDFSAYCANSLISTDNYFEGELNNFNNTNDHSCNVTITDGKFFKIVKEKCSVNKIIASCVKCEPNIVEIRGHNNSSSNFICHLKRKHGDKTVEEYTAYLKEKRRSKTHYHNERSTPRSMLYYGRNNGITQEEFEMNILKFVLHSFVPIKTIDDPYFHRILQNLNIGQSSLRMINSLMLELKMEKLFQNNIEYVKNQFKSVPFICITADVWCYRGEGYLAVSAHTINQEIERLSNAIAFRRIIHPFTSDNISELLNKVYLEYGLAHTKIISTIIDNGSDCMQAFKMYGVERRSVDVIEIKNYYIQEIETEYDSGRNEEYLTSTLLGSEEMLSILSNSMKACAQTLTFCASNDFIEALSRSGTSYDLHKAIMAKCNILWSAVSHQHSSELLHAVLGYELVRPYQAKWTSLYEALMKITNIKEKSTQVFQALNMKNCITEHEFKFLEEHLICTKPIADALEILQKEKYNYYGAVVPTLIVLRQKLEALLNERQWAFFTPLLKALLNSVNTRFYDIYNFSSGDAMNAAIASLSHPEFKNRWLHCIDVKHQHRILLYFKEAVAAEMLLNIDEEKPNVPSASTDFFDFGVENTVSEQTTRTTSELQVLHFFNDNSRNLNILHRYPEIKTVFIKYNTTLASSAPAQRLFNSNTITGLANSYELYEKNLEMRVLLKATLL